MSFTSRITFHYIKTNPDKFNAAKQQLIFSINEDTNEELEKLGISTWEYEGQHFFRMKYPKTYNFSLEAGQEIETILRYDSFNGHTFIKFPTSVLKVIATFPQPKKLTF